LFVLFCFFKEDRVSLLWIQFQIVGAWNVKERWPNDMVFVLGTERSVSSLDLRVETLLAGDR